jgi:hypothetical protein
MPAPGGYGRMRCSTFGAVLIARITGRESYEIITEHGVGHTLCWVGDESRACLKWV